LFRYSATVLPLAAFAALLPFLVGCGEPIGKVSGRVTFKGEPVTKGSISFNLKGKGVAQDAKLDSSGAYTMATPLPTGTYHVYYVPPTPEPQDPAKGPTPVMVTPVPAKYQDLQTSGLSFDVKAGVNDIPVQIE
jgi:hypothetical protein